MEDQEREAEGKKAERQRTAEESSMQVTGSSSLFQWETFCFFEQ